MVVILQQGVQVNYFDSNSFLFNIDLPILNYLITESVVSKKKLHSKKQVILKIKLLFQLQPILAILTHAE